MINEAPLARFEPLGHALLKPIYADYAFANIPNTIHYLHAAEIASFRAAFDAIRGGVDSPDTLFLFTADNDQVYAPREETIYINEQLPQLADCLPVSSTGHAITRTARRATCFCV
jgi:hypothetical protein